MSSGTPANLGVVAWIGYRTPVDPLQGGNPEVLFGGLAQSGGVKLAAALNGMLATRGWIAEDPRLAIAAHSYGSTTAADALTSSSAGSFTMFGSAGIDTSIPQASDLKVPAGNVFATHAQADWLAPLGQYARVDPLSPAYGAHDFSSEAVVDPSSGQFLNGVTAHDVLVHSATNVGYGYLDLYTDSLRNIALTTMGMGSSVAVYAGPPPLDFSAVEGGMG